MTYKQALDYINGASRLGSQLGLERIRELLERLGDPQKRLRFLHIAGTKGKGSITAMAASALAAGGYRAGGYYSPYIVDFRERMQINGEMISEEALCAVVARVKRSADAMTKRGNPPTVFELITACAMLWYAEQGCDIVALEVGLGGRFDATNVIGPPLVSVISVIDYDHMDILGDTIEQIAAEKCGIIKHGSGAVVSYPHQRPEAMEIIRRTCAEQDVRLVVPDYSAVTDISGDINGNSFRYRGMPLRLNLAGDHQIYNAITALEALAALQHLGFPLTVEAIAEGFAKTLAPARFEIIRSEPLIVVDGAHNPVSMMALRDSMLRYLPRDITAVAGMLRDKDCQACMDIMLPYIPRLIVTEPDNPRAIKPEALARIAARYCPDVTVAANRQDAARQALATGARCILVFGSLYLATDMRKLLME